MTSNSIKLEFPFPHKVFTKNTYKLIGDYSRPLEVHFGGASSGKSHGIIQRFILKALDDWKKPRRMLFLRKVGATIKESVFQHTLDVLSDFKILEMCKVNHTDFRITLPNKAQILFKGMDNPEKIKSIKGISDVFMEEATDFTLNDFTQLRLRLRDKSHKFRQIILALNPVAKTNWVYKTFFEKEYPGASVMHSTYKDNKFLDDETRDVIENLKDTNYNYYRIYALGEFVTLDKLIFTNYEKRIIAVDELKGATMRNGLDFGYVNDPSAFITAWINEKTKTIYITQEYVKKAMLNDEIGNTITNLGFAKEIITADSAEQKSIAELKKWLPRIRAALKGPDSVMNGLQFLLQYKIVIDERCPKTIEEFENYTWIKDKKTDEYINKPIDAFNHTIDAIRYALEEFAIKRKVRSLSKAKLGLN